MIVYSKFYPNVVIFPTNSRAGRALPMIRPFRISIILSMASLAFWSGALIVEKSDSSIYLNPTPLELADEMKSKQQWEDVLLLTRFAQQHVAQHQPDHRIALQKQAEERLDSLTFLAERFTLGVLTGEPVDTASLLGSLSLDVLVVGDIRDLLVQGFREVNAGNGDIVIMALSATGLLLTIAPELSWAPGLLKGFYRGGKISRPLMLQIEKAAKIAVKTGNVVPLRQLLNDFSAVVKGLGAGPSLTVMKQIRTADELALLAGKATIAPAETYTITRLAGIGQVKAIKSEGKLVKTIKLGARQQKIIGKIFLALPMSLLILIFSLSTGAGLYLFAASFIRSRI